MRAGWTAFLPDIKFIRCFWYFCLQQSRQVWSVPVFLLPNLTCCLFTAVIFVQISAAAAAASLYLTVHLDHSDVFTFILCSKIWQLQGKMQYVLEFLSTYFCACVDDNIRTAAWWDLFIFLFYQLFIGQSHKKILTLHFIAFLSNKLFQEERLFRSFKN